MIIKFADMVQVNQKTKFLRRIRLSMELKDQNGFFVYEYEKENRKWFVYNVDTMIEIAKALENDQTVLSNKTHEIDLEKLLETNLETKATRKIHSLKSRMFDKCSFLLLECLRFSSGKITFKCFNSFEQTVIRYC